MVKKHSSTRISPECKNIAILNVLQLDHPELLSLQFTIMNKGIFRAYF